MNAEQTGRSETSAYKIQKPGNQPQERIQRSQHRKSLKSGTFHLHTPKQIKIKTGKTMIFIFFFHWHYSPLWALACRTRSFHFFLSVANFLHHR
jgi:hypothetical protein